jgi:CzcA family heavy metal efflux pump
MLRLLVGSSLRYRYLVLAIAAGLIYFGIQQLRNMPVDVFPEFAPPIVEIQTPSLGLSAEEVENLVTIPLEEALTGLPGLSNLRSKSVPQLSSVKLYFERGTDLMNARQTVNERLATVAQNLPTWASPPFMLPPLSATSRIMKIGITSKKLSMMDLSMTAYWNIRQRLLKVPGVANIAIWGERLQMLQVQVDPKRLRDNNVTLDQIMDATSDAVEAGLMKHSEGHQIGTGGWIETPNQRLNIRHVLPIITPQNLADVVLVGADKKQHRLGDIANVIEDHQPMIGDGIIEDDVGLLLIVEKFPWGNTLDVTRGVENALAEMKPGLPDMVIDAEIFRPATFIEMSIDNLTWALILGCILVVLVLFAFLYEWRVALISVVAIPLSLIGAGLVLMWQGVTMNTMVLAGFVIALGAVVDDAIIDIENIVRRIREVRKSGEKYSIFEVILKATFEVRSSIVYATLIIVIALLPVFVMEGLSGAFFKPLATSFALALLVSMLVATTVTPALAMILLRNAPLEKRESPLVVWLHRIYDGILEKTVRSPRNAYIVVGVMFVVGIAVWPLLGQSLLPSFKERDFLMHWLTRPGTGHAEMNRITIQGCKELRTIPGVRNCGAHIGQALIMDEVVGMYFGENWVSVDPEVDYQKTVDKIQETVDGYPGLFRDVLTYLKERIREVLTGTSQAIVIRIYGHDLDVLEKTAHDVKSKLDDVEGLIDLHVELHKNIPQIQVKTDLEKARQYGLKPGEVRRSAAILIAGQEAGDIFREGRAYDVQVWGTPEVRHSPTSLEQLLIDTPSGKQVQLSDVADVRIVPTPNVIEHENLKRRITVSANYRGGDLGSIVAEVEKRLKTVNFPTGYYPELVGEYAERQAAQRQMGSYAIIAAIVIFILLNTTFGSVKMAVLLFLTLPFALVGGVLAAFFSSGIISLGSLVGFLTVFGIAARNGIMMINHFMHLERYEGETFGPHLVIRGAKERLAPILMTATTTGLALVPLVVAGDIPGHEIELPMAIVILGGLVTSTLLNLFIVPSLYLRFGKGVAIQEDSGSPSPAFAG